MRRLFLTLLFAGPLLLATGCAYVGWTTTPLQPPPGLIFEHVKAPMSLNYNQTEANPGKTGRSTSLYLRIPFVGLSFAWMDEASMVNSSRNGGIKEVDFADYELMNVLGIFEQFTVIAYGK